MNHNKVCRTVSLKADPGVWGKFSDLAAERGQSRSALLNRLVEKEVSRYRPNTEQKIHALRLDMIKLILHCKDSEEGWRTARSILNVLNWLIEDDEEKPIIVVAS